MSNVMTSAFALGLAKLTRDAESFTARQTAVLYGIGLSACIREFSVAELQEITGPVIIDRIAPDAASPVAKASDEMSKSKQDRWSNTLMHLCKAYAFSRGGFAAYVPEQIPADAEPKVQKEIIDRNAASLKSFKATQVWLEKLVELGKSNGEIKIDSLLSEMVRLMMAVGPQPTTKGGKLSGKRGLWSADSIRSFAGLKKGGEATTEARAAAATAAPAVTEAPVAEGNVVSSEGSAIVDVAPLSKAKAGNGTEGADPQPVGLHNNGLMALKSVLDGFAVAGDLAGMKAFGEQAMNAIAVAYADLQRSIAAKAPKAEPKAAPKATPKADQPEALAMEAAMLEAKAVKEAAAKQDAERAAKGLKAKPAAKVQPVVAAKANGKAKAKANGASI